MKVKPVYKLISHFFILTVLFIQCDKNVHEIVKDKEDLNFQFNVELVNNQAHLSWKIKNTEQLMGFTIKRCYASKKVDFECDTCVVFNEKEFVKNYNLHYEEMALMDNNFSYNNYQDSLFSYNRELFYKMTVSGSESLVESNYLKLKLPELSVFDISPIKVITDVESNTLYIIDISETVKLYSYSIPENNLVQIYDFGIESNFLPKPDMCIGVFNGVKKLVLPLLHEVHIFNLSNLALEQTFTFKDEYIGAVTSDLENNIYVTGDMGIISRIDYNKKSILKLNTMFYHSEIDLIFNKGFIYSLTLGTNVPTIAKYKIITGGDLIIESIKELQTELIETYDFCTSKDLILLSNGLLFDKDLNLKKKLNVPPSTKIISFSEDGNSIWINKQSTKQWYSLDIGTGQILKSKTLMSFPLFVLPVNGKSINIGNYKLSYDLYLNKIEKVSIEVFDN